MNFYDPHDLYFPFRLSLDIFEIGLSENDEGHFSEETFSNIELKPVKWKYINFRDLYHPFFLYRAFRNCGVNDMTP